MPTRLFRQKRFFGFMAILLLAGCASAKPPIPVDEVPTHVQAKAAGFFMKEGHDGVETYYVLTLTPVKPLEEDIFIEVYFENPVDKYHPLHISQTMKKTDKEFNLMSAQVRNVRVDREYLVDIYAYDNAGRENRLSHLQQIVRPVMDEATFRDMVAASPKRP